MELEEWKQKYGDEKPTKKLLETIIKEVDAVIVRQATCFKDNIVSGSCLSDGCENEYEKTARSLIVWGGPFCDYCVRYKKETRKLIKEHRPDIYNSIISCEFDKDLLTIGKQQLISYLFFYLFSFVIGLKKSISLIKETP